MPKLSRRKKQLKDLIQRGKKDENESGTEENETEDDAELIESQNDVNDKANGSQKQKKVETKPTKSEKKGSKGTKTDTKVEAKTEAKSDVKGEGDKKSDEQEPLWVQCNTCDKWRSLPASVDPDSLPDIWTCNLNIYDPTKNNCEAPEENYSYDKENAKLKSFFCVWVKRLKNNERAENRLPSLAVTRNRKRKLDTEWIKCSNPSCGKWRAVLRSVEMTTIMKRLNRGKKYGAERTMWFCSMNFWDDTKASCSAPQEPLWDCRWNLNTA